MLRGAHIVFPKAQGHESMSKSSPERSKFGESLLIGPAGAADLNQGEGFTSIELMVVVAILIALVAVALPGLSGWASNQRLKGVARDLVTHFQLARLEAIKRRTTVALTFNPGEPRTGNYTVFVDDGAGGGTAGNLVQDNWREETLARTVMPFGVTLTGTTFVSDLTGYNSRGFPVAASFPATEGKVTVANEERSYEVILQKTSGGLSLEGPL